MPVEHIRFETSDAIKLPGLLHCPSKQTDIVALYLHGNGGSSIFYSADKMNAIAMALNRRGIAFFPFNNRGAHLIQSFKKKTGEETERVTYGMAYELIDEVTLDVTAAIEFLKSKGFNTFYLIGTSTGANKIVVYNKLVNPNLVSKYILLSGGDDMGLYYQEFGKEKFLKVLHKGKEMVEQRKGRKLVPGSIVPYPISWQSLYDTINPDGDYNIFPYNEYMNNLHLSKKPLFHAYKAITKPTLVVYGELDEYCYGDVPRCVEILREQAAGKPNFNYQIIPGADHGFSEHENELAKTIADWLGS